MLVAFLFFAIFLVPSFIFFILVLVNPGVTTSLQNLIFILPFMGISGSGHLKKPITNHRVTALLSVCKQKLSVPLGPIQVINEHADILTSKTIMMKIHRRQLCRGRAIRHCIEESTAHLHQFYNIVCLHPLNSAKPTSLVWIMISKLSWLLPLWYSTSAQGIGYQESIKC